MRCCDAVAAQTLRASEGVGLAAEQRNLEPETLLQRKCSIARSRRSASRRVASKGQVVAPKTSYCTKLIAVQGQQPWILRSEAAPMHAMLRRLRKIEVTRISACKHNVLVQPPPSTCSRS